MQNGHSKKKKIGLHDQLSLNAGQTYCRMLQGEHHAILSTFIELPFVITIFVSSIFEWPFYTGFTVCYHLKQFWHCKWYPTNGIIVTDCLNFDLPNSISSLRIKLVYRISLLHQFTLQIFLIVFILDYY